ncbi:MAG: 30S ribosomal protein S16 [Candidatus Methylomirabilota bacterium]|nr:30S ribosomal protein S16 [Candidatus Methylomirabilis sp.]NJD69066.1 30S ribosomal protein S16 [candidate division NC10 bacterium]PWB47198.1 MAG: 30S ribosomal protein S16 [candidate division NC10 bacterium]
MAVKIKLRRMGAKKHPFYRLVVGDEPVAAGGKALETLGTYDPHGEPPALSVQAERALHWLQRGAEPTDSARQLLRRAGVMRQLAELKGAAKGR